MGPDLDPPLGQLIGLSEGDPLDEDLPIGDVGGARDGALDAVAADQELEVADVLQRVDLHTVGARTALAQQVHLELYGPPSAGRGQQEEGRERGAEGLPEAHHWKVTAALSAGPEKTPRS